MNKWYKNIYRRNLVDMHINDNDDTYLSKFSAEEYYKYLKLMNINCAMIYIQSHTGLCNFPSKVAKTHRFFISHPKEINKLIDLCKKDHIKVVAYYSLIFNNDAINKHPKWEMINYDHSTWRDYGQRYGLACPNNEEYRKFIIEQLKEIKAQNYHIDGIFFDMPYWEVMCHCKACQRKWQKVSDKPMPKKIDFNDKDSLLYIKKRQEWMGEFTSFVKKEALKLFPNITIEYNYAAVIGCNYLAGSTELINENSEFTGGDLYGDLYNHSFTAKYYYEVTKNQPFEYMTCRCNKNLREHTISKSIEHLESEIMLTCMHHGASLVIDAINPDGSLDTRVAKKVASAFKNELPYEPYLSKGEMFGEIGVYFDSRTQYELNGLASNKECAINVSKTLIENHLPFRVIANSTLENKNLNRYKVIIASSLSNFNNEKTHLKLIDYVKNGGTLYLSGSSDSRLLKEFFDGKVIGFTFDKSTYKHVYKGYDEVRCYINPTDNRYKQYFGEFNNQYPLPIVYQVPLFKCKNGQVKATLTLPYTDPDDNTNFASIHSNPPGIKTSYPAIVENKYGKGKVIYSTALIENDNRYNFKNIFINILKNNYHNVYFDIDTSKYVETIIFKDKDDFYINFFDLNMINEITDRDFKIKINNKYTYTVEELIRHKKIKIVNGLIKGKFNKYLSLKLTRLK